MHVRNLEVTRVVNGHALRAVELRAGRGSPVAREWLGVPVPATVVIIPAGEILRMRLLPKSAIYKLPKLSIAGPLGALYSP